MTSFFSPGEDEFNEDGSLKTGSEDNTSTENTQEVDELETGTKPEEKNTTETPKKTSILDSDVIESNDLGEYLKTLKEIPKQNEAANNQNAPDPLLEEQVKLEQAAKNGGKASDKSQKTAKMVVSTFDFAFAKTAQTIANAETSEKYKAAPDEKADLIEAWSDYIEFVGMDLPPWLAVTLMMTMVYGFKIPTVVKDRKAYLEVKAAAKAKMNPETSQNNEQKETNESSEVKPKVTVTDITGHTCTNCGNELSADQIKLKRKFCSTKCSNGFKAKVIKEMSNIKNQQ